MSLAERWYRTLADDVASPGEWLQAAGNIVQHENVRVIPGSTAFGQTVTTPLPKGARPKLAGEVLREKKDPSVAELMAMRIKEIDPGGPVDHNSSDQYKVGSANQMAAMLAEWDPTSGLAGPESPCRPLFAGRAGRAKGRRAIPRHRGGDCRV